MISIRLGFTDDSSCIFNKTVRAITGGPGHVLVEVTGVLPKPVIFESVWKKDASTHKSGVRMASLEKIQEWVAEKPETRIYYTVPDREYLPLTQDEAQAAVAKLYDSVRTIHYAELQLVGNLLARAGVRLGFGGGSETRWTCCETVVRARVLPPRFWDLVGMDNINADELWPGGSARYSLEAAARRVVQAYGVH